jgi:biopolymer transport protein ExbD
LKIKRKHKHGAEVPTHALNDIMFFLLLFFLIISALAKPDTRSVENPTSDSSLQLSEKMVNLTITDNKEYYIDNNPIKAEDLESSLQKISKENEDVGVSIAIDKKLKVSDIVEVMNYGKKFHLRMFLKTSKKAD